MWSLMKACCVVLVLGATVTIAQRTSPRRRPPRRGKPAENLRNHVEIVERDGFRIISSNGIPDHPTGRFPNRNNPNAIQGQTHTFRMPLKPRAAGTPTRLGLFPFGVAVNGVPFDPGAAEFWNRNPNSGWQYEANSGKINLGLDQNNAHVQPTGAYHYHGLPTALIARLHKTGEMLLIGYAADGFPIYAPFGHTVAGDASSEIRAMRSSFRLKQGMRPGGPRGRYDGTFVEDYEYVAGSGDLDECNGRVGVTTEYPAGIYHYFITAEFPFIPRQFRGTPDDSFRRHGLPPGRGPGSPPRPF